MTERRYYCEGWCWPMRTRKAHYFREGRSLCGWWQFVDKVKEPDVCGPNGPRCKECRQELANLKRESVDTEDGKQKTEAAEEVGKIGDAVCPLCFQALPNPAILPLADRYGRELRKYLGFCPNCKLGCETIQFRRDGRWVIHRYQIYAYIGTYVQKTGNWITLNGLPEPAPIVTGPGGDFDRRITPKCGELLARARAS